jgi:hypothetical protein
MVNQPLLKEKHHIFSRPKTLKREIKVEPDLTAYLIRVFTFLD